MAEHQLWVFDGASRVGSVTFDSLEERFNFTYVPTWAQSPEAYPLSPAFPLNTDPTRFGSIRRFLENLLPEGRALDIVTTTHQISRNNIFGLIREIGRETAGALSFLPEGMTPAGVATELREISREELAQRIADRAHLPFSVWDGRVRMSIAGFQDKLPVYQDGGRLYLAQGRYASTHILKPEPVDARLAGLVVNEHFCMQLARRIGLETAEVDILRLPDPVLAVARFDRQRGSDGVGRRHTIDACQALDYPVAYKYERNFGSGRDVSHIRDGVSFARLFDLAALAPRKAQLKMRLMRWALYQYLIGNADAHGKNISFYCHQAGLELAPCYDLVSVVQFPEVEHELAMAYGDEFALDVVGPFDFADFASRVGIPRSVLAREMARMAKAAMKAVADQASSDAYLETEQSQVATLRKFVEGQATKLQQAIAPMLAVPAGDL